jgi:hypothetical protein
VNGELAQQDDTGNLLFPFGQLVADLSRLMTLQPGDLILTGTPAGASVLEPGDIVEVEVDGSRRSTGRLRTAVAAAEGELHRYGAMPRADVQSAADEIADRVPYLPGTGPARLDETLELTAAASDAGADACLIITPYYARPTQQALYKWYATVAKEFPGLPLVIYNVPSPTAVDVAPETVARLFRDFDNIAEGQLTR